MFFLRVCCACSACACVCVCCSHRSEYFCFSLSCDMERLPSGCARARPNSMGHLIWQGRGQGTNTLGRSFRRPRTQVRSNSPSRAHLLSVSSGSTTKNIIICHNSTAAPCHPASFVPTRVEIKTAYQQHNEPTCKSDSYAEVQVTHTRRMAKPTLQH